MLITIELFLLVHCYTFVDTHKKDIILAFIEGTWDNWLSNATFGIYASKWIVVWNEHEAILKDTLFNQLELICIKSKYIFQLNINLFFWEQGEFFFLYHQIKTWCLASFFSTLVLTLLSIHLINHRKEMMFINLDCLEGKIYLWLMSYLSLQIIDKAHQPCRQKLCRRLTRRWKKCDGRTWKYLNVIRYACT